MTSTNAPGLLTQTCGLTAIAADLNNDGFPDIARDCDNRVEVYLNKGPTSTPPWSFGNATGAPSYTLVGATGFTLLPAGMAWMDYNNDKYLDLVLDNHTTIEMLKNPGNGTAAFTRVSPRPSGLDITAHVGDWVAVADYDGDGDVDLLDRKNNEADLYRNNGNQTFTADGGFNYSAPNDDAGAVLFCDFDNDGLLDIFWADGGVDQTMGAAPKANQVWRQKPTGGWVNTEKPLWNPAVTGDTNGVACGDVDNDGDLDLVANTLNNDLVYLNASTPGNVAFVQNNMNLTGIYNGKSVSLVDYDNDGDLDAYLNQDEKSEMFVNRLDNKNYLMVRVLVETAPGKARIDHGATLRLLKADASPATGTRHVDGGSGSGNQDSPIVHFGLAQGPGVEYQVRVDFQGSTQSTANIRVRPNMLGNYQILTILDVDPDGDGTKTPQEVSNGTNPYLADTDGNGVCDGPKAVPGYCTAAP